MVGSRQMGLSVGSLKFEEEEPGSLTTHPHAIATLSHPRIYTIAPRLTLGSARERPDRVNLLDEQNTLDRSTSIRTDESIAPDATEECSRFLSHTSAVSPERTLMPILRNNRRGCG